MRSRHPEGRGIDIGDAPLRDGVAFDEPLAALAEPIGSVDRPGEYRVHGRTFAPTPRVVADDAGILSSPVPPVQLPHARPGLHSATEYADGGAGGIAGDRRDDGNCLRSAIERPVGTVISGTTDTSPGCSSSVTAACSTRETRHGRQPGPDRDDPNKVDAIKLSPDPRPPRLCRQGTRPSPDLRRSLRPVIGIFQEFLLMSSTIPAYGARQAVPVATRARTPEHPADADIARWQAGV